MDVFARQILAAAYLFGAGLIVIKVIKKLNFLTTVLEKLETD